MLSRTLDLFGRHTLFVGRTVSVPRQLVLFGRHPLYIRRQVYLQLGRKKSTDSIVQSGRPDFSVFPFGDHRKCADIVIEAKGPGEMEGDKKLRDAFDQGESYASRQYAELLILADDKQLLFYFQVVL